MDPQTLVPLAVRGSLMLVVLGVGLQGSWRDLTYVVDRPGLFGRAIVAVNVIVPAVAIVLCMIFPIASTTKAGIILMAVSPLAPFVLGKMLKTGADRPYVVGVYVALILASVLIVPTTIELLGLALGRDYQVPISTLARFIGISILLPLAAGLIISSLWPRLAARASRIATVGGFVLLLPILLLLIYKTGALMLSLLGDGTLFVIAATVLSGFAAGHFLGGRSPEHRLALANAAAARHPGMAGLIAGLNFTDSKVMIAVLLFLLSGLVFSSIYASWLAKHYAARTNQSEAEPL